MSIVHASRHASVDEIAAEMDRRGAVIEKVEAERNLYKGKYRSMASLMEKARSQIRQISDHTEDEGDRAFFGSTNHADWLQDLAEDMEAWVIDFELPKGDINKMESDPYAAIREQRARAEKAETALAAKDAEIARMHDLNNDAHAIIGRIWSIFDNPSYEGLNGRTIYDLIQHAVDQNAELVRLRNKVPARALTDRQLSDEIAAVDAVCSQGFGEGSGSPGEWWCERADELEYERKRREIEAQLVAHNAAALKEKSDA